MILQLLVGIAMMTNPVQTFEIGNEHFLLNGKPFLIRCGEMHFARIPRPYWRHRLQMAKAMGMNAVCAYLFWNQHEPTEGKFDWTEQADAAEFCRIAQSEGLWVILRPGPYSCAEWDFGGFPYWLLKHKEIKLRTRDATYMAAVKKYFESVGEHLSKLQVTKGGPILMVQVENEYGSYGSDKEYIGDLATIIRQSGFDVPLFTCDGPSQLKNDTRDDIFSVVNFGGNPDSNFKALRAIRPSGPLMCGEYYPGWFDSWGAPHHVGAIDSVIRDLESMLKVNASFSMYMVHGGTSFGFSSGANAPPYSPQSTSYDYDAPISEAGWATPKFFAIRNLFSKYLQSGESIPEVPSKVNVITIPKFKFTNCAAITQGLKKSRVSENPLTFESLDQAHGCILYSTEVPKGQKGVVSINELHDFGLVSWNGKQIAKLDRRRGQNSFELPLRNRLGKLEILVEAMGRVNYGGLLHDRKGITEDVSIQVGETKTVLTNWTHTQIPLTYQSIRNLNFGKQTSLGPHFWKETFDIKEVGDTFLDMSSWGKGYVWVNGHNLGRYWNIGPQQTLYLPGCWLKKGKNEIIVLELLDPKSREIQGLANPILDKVTLPPVVVHKKPNEFIDLSGNKPCAEGELPDGRQEKIVKLATTIQARYFCLEAQSSQSGDPFTTLAEIKFIDKNGKPIDSSRFRVIFADSEEYKSELGTADFAIDGSKDTFWHTAWSGAQPSHPHHLVIDFGKICEIGSVKLLPRQDSPNGNIKSFKIYLTTQKFKGLL